MDAEGTPNPAQREQWDGPIGAYWVAEADRFERGVAAYRGPFEEACAVGSGDRVVDVGCGGGATTRAAARRAPGGHALGVDLSSPLIELARRRTADDGPDNASFAHADAQVHPFAVGSADLVISRHGAMFFDDPVAAFANIRRALSPGGRLVLLVWQPVERNPFIHRVLEALTPDRETPLPPADRPSPVALGDPDRVRAVLAAAGYAEVTIDGVERPMHLGDDPDDAVAFVGGQHAGLLEGLDAARRERAVARLHADAVAHHEPGAGVRYGSAAWLVRARAAGSRA